MKNLWLFVLLVLILTSSSFGALKKRANVLIKSVPNHIDIFINNKHFRTPTNMYIKPGKITVWGAKVHYLTYKCDYVIPRKHSKTIVIQMQKDTSYEPPEGSP